MCILHCVSRALRDERAGGGNATGQRAAGSWAAATLRAPRLVSSYEVPFANANGKTVTPEACRAFGRASARVLRAFLEE